MMLRSRSVNSELVFAKTGFMHSVKPRTKTPGVAAGRKFCALTADTGEGPRAAMKSVLPSR
jgi:hypothetical protein